MLQLKSISIFIFIVVLLTSCGSAVKETGKASYYGDEFEGRRTASGAIFRQNRLTAAHKTLPFGTKLRVTNLQNNKTVKVTVNDRGPFVKGRSLDLSKKAAKKLGMIQSGVANVSYKYKKKRNK